MKYFNRTTLIPSLAASAMVAVATLAPLPGLLAAGNVYAHDNTTPHVEVGKLARPNLAAIQGQNEIDVKITYTCSPIGLGTPNLDVKVLQNNIDQTGNGVVASGENPTTPIKCDGHEYKVAVTVTPNLAGGTIPNGVFNVSKATVRVKETDPLKVSKSDKETDPSKVSKSDKETDPSKVSKSDKETDPLKVSKSDKETDPSKVSKSDKETDPSKVSKSDKETDDVEV